MGELYFKVGSDYEEVIRLRNEVGLLQNRLRNFTPGTSESVLRDLQARLGETTARLRSLTGEAAVAGANLEHSIRQGANGAIRAIYELRSKLSDPITGALSIAGIGALGGFLNQVSNIRSQFQQMEQSINVLLQSDTKGSKLMSQLTEFAKISPLDFKGTVSAAQQMIGFGIDYQKVPRYIQAISDVSMGDASRFNSLTLAFSQMSAAGKLMGQDLMQMVNAGFQPLQIMAEKTGKSIGQLKEEMSKGKISAEMVQQAFIDATSAGGRYYKMSEKASQTIGGQMSMLEDAFDLMYNDLGKKSEGTIIKVIEGATSIVENYDKILPVLGTVIAALGVYKASAMAAAFADRKAGEERARAIVDGFNKELEKIDEVKKKRLELEAVQAGLDKPSGFVKGARYDSAKSGELVEKIMPDLGQSAQKRSSLDAAEKARKSQARIELENIDAEIKEHREQLRDVERRLREAGAENDRFFNEYENALGKRNKLANAKNPNPVRIAEADAEVADAKSRLDVSTDKMNQIGAERRGIEESIRSARERRADAIETSKTASKQYMRERKAIEELEEAENRFAASDGSISKLKEQLDLFGQTYEAMSPEEKASEFGMALREQIQGIEAELSGMANLDSDLSDLLAVGDIDESLAQRVQEARNDIADEIAAIDELIAAKEDEHNASEIAVEDATQAVEKAHEKADAIAQELAAMDDSVDMSDRMAKVQELEIAAADEENAVRERNTAVEREAALSTEVNELQKKRQTITERQNSLATVQNTGAAAANTAGQNLNTAATSRNSLAVALNSVKTKASAVAHHLLRSGIDSVRNALNSLKAAWVSNPIGLILTAVTTAIGAFMSWKASTEDVSEEQKEFGNDALETRDKVDKLYAVMAAADKGSKTYKDAIEELKGIAKDYGLQIKDEANLHDQLIAKKEQLIELIKEEGRQRQIASNIEDIQNRIKKDREKIRDYLADQIDSDNAVNYADMIIADMDIDKLAELGQRYRQLTEFKFGHQTTEDERREIELLEKQIQQLLDKSTEGAQKMANSLDGAVISLSAAHTSLFGGENWITSFLPQLSQIQGNIKTLEHYQKVVSESQSLTKSLAEQVEAVKLPDLSMDDLGKKMKESLSAIKTASESSLTVKVDTSELDKLIKALGEAAGKADEASSKKVAPSSDTTQVEKVAVAADDAGKALSDADDKTVEPGSDSAQVDKIAESAVQAKGELDRVDDTTARPTVDITSILNAISSIQMVKTMLQGLNGVKTTAYNTAEEARRIEELRKNFRKDVNGNLVGSRRDVEEYRKLINRGKSRATFNFGTGATSLSPEEARIMEYFRANSRFQTRGEDGVTRIDLNKMSRDERSLYNQLAASKKKTMEKSSNEAAQKEWKAQKADMERRIKAAKTANELDEISKQLSPLKGDMVIGSADEKWLNRQLDNIKNKKGGKSKKGGKDPKDEAWRRAEEERKYDESIKEAVRKRERELTDARIDAMEDGTAKTLAKIANDARKERDALESEAEKTARSMMEKDRQMWIREEKVPNGKKKTRYEYKWDEAAVIAKDPKTYSEYLADVKEGEETMSAGDYYASLDHEAKTMDFYRRMAEDINAYSQKRLNIQERERRELKKVYDGQSADMREYLKEYGTYEQKRRAIEESYLRQIEEYDRTGDTVKAMNTRRKMDSEVSSLEGEQLFRNINWEVVFSDVSRYTSDVLSSLRSQLENILRDNKIELKLEDKQRIIEKLDEIDEAFKSNRWSWKDAFGLSIPALKAQKDAMEDLAKAQERYRDAQNDLNRAFSENMSARFSIASHIRENTGVDMDTNDITSESFGDVLKLFQSQGKDSSRLGGLFSLLGKSEAGLQTAQANAAQAGQQVAAAEGTAEGGSGASALAVTDTIIHGINDNLQSMPELLEELGISQSKFGKGMAKFAESSQYATQAFDALKSGNIVGVASNLMGALRTLGDSLGEWGIGFMGASDKSLADDIECLTEVNKELTRAVQMLTDEMKDLRTSEILGQSEKMMEDLRNAERNTREMMQRSAEAYSNGFLGIGGKGSGSKKINEGISVSDWARISQAAGVSVRDASDFFSLTSEQMSRVLKETPDLYQKIKMLAADGYADASEFMDEYISYWEQMKDITDATLERLTSTSFDGVLDGFKSLLMDMTDDLSRFSENFEKMMRQALIDSIVNDKYTERLKKWYEKFAEFRGNDSEGGNDLTVAEQDELREDYMNIARDAQEEVKELGDMLGWNSQYSQQSGAKTYSGMSQDQGDELNGRLTAIAVTAESIRIDNSARNSLLSSIDANVLTMMLSGQGMLSQVESVATTLALINLDIAEIRDNTAAVVKPIKSISSYIYEIKEKIKNV